MNTSGGPSAGEPKRASLRADFSPTVRQQRVELLNRALSDAREYILEPGEWVHLRQFAGCNEAPQHRHRSSAAITSYESSIAPPQGNPAQASFGVVVVDGQV